MSTKIDFNSFADGAASEKINREIQRVLENIDDPNTDHKAKRTVTLTLTMTADEKRELVTTDVQVKSKLAPAKSVGSTLILGHDNGKVVGAELKSGAKGQTYWNEDGELAEDTGEVIEDEEAGEEKVVDFRKQKSSK
ncbi:replication terminator protein [Jeotgalibacillus haloalkalitolerans]|uniref:Replication terminator protein n=1 Tax=Jeotgalibacillus haloalkalitolerans TaxID=3104292 RepID=A0ABU5KLX2_9BACL|nr:replication terminator protein [Jeotgalibacillus sp. HH7-29]MDZ5712265.1 replication terminator protein [Jeotgalibacillus sp. HH7-29]